MAYKVNDARQTFFKYLHITEQDVEFIENTDRRGFIYNLSEEEKCVIFIYPISHKKDDSKNFIDTRDSGAAERGITWNYAIQNKLKYFCFAVNDQVDKYKDYIFSLECQEKIIEKVSGTLNGTRAGAGTQVVIPNNYIPSGEFKRILTRKGFFISVIHIDGIIDYIHKYDNRPYLMDDSLVMLDSIEINKQDENQYMNEDTEEYELAENNKIFNNVISIEEELAYISKFIQSYGFYYDELLIRNFYISLRTKPFVILSGISGTGKSKIVELFARAVGATLENKRFKLVPVKSEWSDATELLGYRNIEGKFIPGIITQIASEAMENLDKPYFLCLDEMNLARVEYYFSDILSLIETRKVDDYGKMITNKLLSMEQFGVDEDAKEIYGNVYIPENLYIIGTVNMDETTFPFSKKVLDRANTIEFNKVDLSYDFGDNKGVLIEKRNYKNDFLKSEYLNLANCKEDKEIAMKSIGILEKINSILEEYNQHFGYRVRDEIVFYMIYAVKNNLLTFDKAFDICVVQKVLPKLSGSNNYILEILIKLYNLFNETNYKSNECFNDLKMNEIENNINDSFKISCEKIIYMIRRFVRDGFTTFWQ